MVCIFQEQIAKIDKEIQSIDLEIKTAQTRSKEAEKNLQEKEEEAENYDDNKLDDKLTEIDRKIERQNIEQQTTGDRIQKLETEKVSLSDKVTQAKEKFAEKIEAINILGGESIETKRKSKDVQHRIKLLQDGNYISITNMQGT